MCTAWGFYFLYSAQICHPTKITTRLQNLKYHAINHFRHIPAKRLPMSLNLRAMSQCCQVKNQSHQHKFTKGQVLYIGQKYLAESWYTVIFWPYWASCVLKAVTHYNDFHNGFFQKHRREKRCPYIKLLK